MSVASKGATLVDHAFTSRRSPLYQIGRLAGRLAISVLLRLSRRRLTNY